MNKKPEAAHSNPGRILGISGAYWRSCTLHAGVRLELFTALGDDALTGAELASRVEGDERAVSGLADALVALELLHKEEGRYRNTEESARFLVHGSPHYLGFMVRHHAHLVDSFGRLDEAVRTGEPVRGRASTADEEQRRDFLMGMHNNTQSVAARAASSFDLSGRRRLLDLGGGPGTWAIHFALANPELSATIFDLPTTRPFAEETVARFGLSERVSFAAGDFNSDPLPDGFDVAWLSHILHGEGPDACEAIIAKAARALRSGGLLMIHEFILDEDKTSPEFPALFNLNMLAGTPEGRSYSRSELEAMMRRAGVVELRLLDFVGPTRSRVLAGIVAGSGA